MAIGNLLCGQAKDIHIIVADILQHLDIGSIEGSHGERAIHREFHVPSSGSFHSGSRDLLAQVSSRNNDLGERDAVIRDEGDLDLLIYAFVGIDDAGNVVDELDDLCCGDIRRRRLPGKDISRRCSERLAIFGDSQVVIRNPQQVQQLTLVFVKALDVDIEHRVRVDEHSGSLSDYLRKALLVLALDLAKL